MIGPAGVEEIGTFVAALRGVGAAANHTEQRRILELLRVSGMVWPDGPVHPIVHRADWVRIEWANEFLGSY